MTNTAEMIHLSTEHSVGGLWTLKPDLVMDSQRRRWDWWPSAHI